MFVVVLLIFGCLLQSRAEIEFVVFAAQEEKAQFGGTGCDGIRWGAAEDATPCSTRSAQEDRGERNHRSRKGKVKSDYFERCIIKVSQ